jgi:probable rRNA maturation factor
MEVNILLEEGLEIGADSGWLRHIVEKTLGFGDLPPNVEISLLLTGQERIRELNREYRGLDQPTDVLSFGLGEEKAGDEPLAFIGPPDGLLHLGEVIISYPQAGIQAAEHGHSLEKELTVLAVHGVLHILGYDHESGDDGEAMFKLQTEIVAGLEKERA